MKDVIRIWVLTYDGTRLTHDVVVQPGHTKQDELSEWLYWNYRHHEDHMADAGFDELSQHELIEFWQQYDDKST